MSDIKLIEVKEEDRVNGEEYLCLMKHGYIQGWWDAEEGTCRGYYWHDIEWFPTVTYIMEFEDETNT